MVVTNLVGGMVWFSSAMDLKKLAFLDQFPYCVSPRRKVVSGFGLGVVASFIVLSVILLSVSFKAPFLNPMFQGFSSLGSSNTSFVSWPLSHSSTTGLSSSSTGTSSTTATNTTELQNSVDGNERVGKVKVVDQIHEANVSEIGKDGKYLDINGNGIVMEETHAVNFSEKVENGSFTTEGGRIQEKTQKVNGEEIDKSANFSSSGGGGIVLDNTHLGNFSEKVKNGSFIGGDVIAGEVVKRHANESSLGKYKIAENNNEGNRSYNEENVGSPSTVKASEINNGGISSGENNNATSLDDSQKMHNGECDIFDGKWVRDGTKPYYPPGSCPYIGRDFNCHLNRRPDDWFLKWKWQPNGCGIPSLNATDFLERLRGKKLVFVGDSLNRNMWESLVCILRHSVRNKKKVYEISGRREFKKKGFYAFRFEDYNCTVDFVGAPFLVRESSFNGRNGSFETLRLDLMDRTTSMYHDADVIVFNTGHWWTHEKTSRGEDYYQEGNHVYPRLKVLEAYKKALTTWARWVDKNIDSSRTQVIFRGYSVTHFRGGQWNSGGQCHKETEPIFNETYLAKYPSKMRVLEHVLNGMKTPVVYLNISRITDYRKDGHPSIYRKEYKTVKEQIASVHSQDCSHWCLPGVPDTWNELLYASLLKAGKGSWRS